MNTIFNICNINGPGCTLILVGGLIVHSPYKFMSLQVSVLVHPNIYCLTYPFFFKKAYRVYLCIPSNPVLVLFYEVTMQILKRRFNFRVWILDVVMGPNVPEVSSYYVIRNSVAIMVHMKYRQVLCHTFFVESSHWPN